LRKLEKIVLSRPDIPCKPLESLASERFEERRAALKLMFAERLQYAETGDLESQI
jgi:hypothetical protein